MIVGALVLDFVGSFVVREKFAVLEVLHAILALQKFLKLGYGQIAKHLLVGVLFWGRYPLPVHVDLKAGLASDLEKHPMVIEVYIARYSVAVVESVFHSLGERLLQPIQLQHVWQLL